MSISFGFGSGGASSGTYVGNYTGQHYIYGYAGAYPTGNPSVGGGAPVAIDNIILNGSWSATNGFQIAYSTNGYVYVYYNTGGGTGKLNFTRFFGNGGRVDSDTGDVWTGGGLQGTIYWSTVPSAPQSIAYQRTGRSVFITTNGGNISDGGAALQYFWLQHAPAGGYWTDDGNISSGSFMVNNLTPGVSYYFRTFAHNKNGDGTQINTPLVTIPNLPTAPTLSIVKNAASVTLTIGDTSSVDAPTYYAQVSLDNVTWQSAVTVTSANPRTYTYTGLTPGQTYFFRAYATSAVGQGAYSTVQSTTIATVPSAPASVSTVRSGRSVTVSVGASSSTGGDPITSYGIQYSNDGGSNWSAAVLADANRQYVFNNLTTGTTYVFRSYATNDIGNSPTTSAPGVFISGYGKRYDQASVTGVSGDGTNMTFTAPGHGFSATDLVDVVGVTPSTLDVTQQQITAVTADTFTIAGTVTDAYTSGGTAQGFKMVLNGNRWNGTAWVPVTTTQKIASGTTYTSFN